MRSHRGACRRLVIIAMAVFAGSDAAVACDFAVAAPAFPGGAESWLASAPGTIVRSLEKRGLAFPRRGVEGLCPEMAPAIVVFAHPPDRVFELLTQTERQGEVMEFIESIEPVSRGPGDHVDRHELKILFRRIRYHVRHHWNGEARRLWWNLDPSQSNDIRDIRGYWELYPLGGDRSLGLYASAVDVGPVIPKRMQAALTRKNVRAAVESFRRWVDAEGGKLR